MRIESVAQANNIICPCLLFFYILVTDCTVQTYTTIKTATGSNGELRWEISYPKAFKGEKAVSKTIKGKAHL